MSHKSASSNVPLFQMPFSCRKVASEGWWISEGGETIRLEDAICFNGLAPENVTVGWAFLVGCVSRAKQKKMLSSLFSLIGKNASSPLIHQLPGTLMMPCPANNFLMV